MTPKERFLKNESKVRAWNDMAEGGLFIEALETALSEFTRTQVGQVKAVYEAQAVSHRLVGAQMFAAVLSRLGLVDEPKKEKEPGKLDYESFGVSPGMARGFENLEQS